MMTARQRTQINRKNAAKSTGPKTEEGKARSARNAWKHGLRAESLALPIDDLDMVQALIDDWFAFYRPDSPAEAVLIERALYEILQLRRCATQQQAIVSQQVRHALFDFDRNLELEIEPFKVSLMSDDPGPAIYGLERTSAGCRWLIGYWEGYAAELEAGTIWKREDRHLAIRLTALHPTRPGIESSAVSRVLDRLQEIELESYEETDETRAAREQGREQARLDLIEAVAEQLEDLRPREERARLVIEEPDRAEAIARALIPEGPKASLFQRYERMHELAYHRVQKEIQKAIKASEEAENAWEFEPDEEGNGLEMVSESAVPEVEEASAPNEAKGGYRARIRAEQARTCDVPPTFDPSEAAAVAWARLDRLRARMAAEHVAEDSGGGPTAEN